MHSLGCFNPILDFDSQLFIDPRLLNRTAAPELRGAHNDVTDYFMLLLQALRKSKTRDDIFWKSSKDMFAFPEFKGLCLVEWPRFRRHEVYAA